MQRGAVPAAFGRKEFNQRTVTPGYPPVFPVVPRHPLVAECQGAKAPRVGCVVTLDGPSDRAPQFGVSRIGKMRLQKFGNGQIGLYLGQRLVKPAHMRRRRLVGL